MSSELPKPVSELVKTPSGRQYLQKLRSTKYKFDVLQPRNPDGTRNELYHKVYGEQKKRQEAQNQRRERLASDEWAEMTDKRLHEEMRASGHMRIRDGKHKNRT